MRSTGKIISVLISILAVALLSLSTQAFALEQNGLIEMPFTENAPTIDGKFTTQDEWSQASETMLRSGSNVAYVYATHDRDKIYIFVDAIFDRTDIASGDFIDFAMLCFDKKDHGNNIPTEDDFCYLAYKDKQSGSGVYYGKSEGGWTQISASQSSPVTSSVGFNSQNSLHESGRDHRTYEFAINLSYLSLQDKYGFSIIVYDKANAIGLTWPEGLSYGKTIYEFSPPSSWGTIKSQENSVTAPPIPVISVSTKSISFNDLSVSDRNSKSITITNVGTSILKISDIIASSEFSIGKSLSFPIDLKPNENLDFDAVFAPLTIGEKSGSIKILSNDISNPTFSIQVSGRGMEKTSSPFGGRCLIATAAFGSELSPQVQFLRGFRDNHILATESGSSFMNVFNAWYYSFSPYVADYERQQPWLQEIVRTSIYPLLGILTLSEKGFSTVQGDYGAVVAGSIASSMIGAVYFWPFAMIAKPIRNSTSKYNYKLALVIFGATLIATVASILSANQTALMITTSLFVLSLTAIFATLSAKYVVRVAKKLTNRKFLPETHRR